MAVALCMLFNCLYLFPFVDVWFSHTRSIVQQEPPDLGTRNTSHLVEIALETFLEENTNDQREVKELTKPVSNNRLHNAKTTISWHDHCVVNVHGMHHTGTGYLREIVYESLGGVAGNWAFKHERTHEAEDEGQHVQTVYPAYYARDKLCGRQFNGSNQEASIVGKKKQESPAQARVNARKYYCPELALKPIQDDERELLFCQWAKYWDMAKAPSFLIQKTPTLDLLYLERMKLGPMAHVAVVRHPMMIGGRVSGGDPTLLLQKWINIWSHVLSDQLIPSTRGPINAERNETIQAYAIVNYEALTMYHDTIVKDLSTFIKDGCGVPFSNISIGSNDNTYKLFNETTTTPTARTRQRRRLEIHPREDGTKYLTPSKERADIWEQCKQTTTCRIMMDELTPVLNAFGYSAWNFTMPYQLVNTNRLLLFTSNSPPSFSLVKQLTDLCTKYC